MKAVLSPPTDLEIRLPMLTSKRHISDPPVSRAPARIAAMFNAIARRYDLLNHLLSAGLDRRWRRLAVRSLCLSGRERVLDLCTGTADLAISAMISRPAAARVIGVDFAAAMLEVGQAKLRERRMAGSIRLVRGDAASIPAADRSVDAVTIGFGIRNVDDVRAACREIHRVLRPGGRFAILEFSIPSASIVRIPYLWYFTSVLPRIGRALSRREGAYEYLPASVAAFATPDELAAILQDSEFVDVTMVPLTLGIVFLYTGRRGSQ
jgi:demethylmenaquinone methyltransferase / 2-methoxy-6-polyprenyl-1,4-benzoquinol methylase